MGLFQSLKISFMVRRKARHVLNKWLPYILMAKTFMHPSNTAQSDQQLDLVGQQETWIGRDSVSFVRPTKKLLKQMMAGILTTLSFHEKVAPTKCLWDSC